MMQIQTEAQPSYCDYEVMLLVLRNPHVVSPSATDHAIDWIINFNRCGRVAFTLPLSLTEAHHGITVIQDESAGPQ